MKISTTAGGRDKFPNLGRGRNGLRDRSMAIAIAFLSYKVSTLRFVVEGQADLVLTCGLEYLGCMYEEIEFGG
jgi:hypothetical protein